MPIYFSTGGYKNQDTFRVVKDLVSKGLNFIELSGTSYSPNNIEKLIEFMPVTKFQIHNYFPPPKIPFVINLASMNEEIYQRSINHIFFAIENCKKINSTYYSFHAGFLCDIDVNDIGKGLKKKFYKIEKIAFHYS